MLRPLSSDPLLVGGEGGVALQRWLAVLLLEPPSSGPLLMGGGGVALQSWLTVLPRALLSLLPAAGPRVAFPLLTPAPRRGWVEGVWDSPPHPWWGGGGESGVG